MSNIDTIGGLIGSLAAKVIVIPTIPNALPNLSVSEKTFRHHF